MGTAADLEEFEWEFFVVDDPDDVNAECMPNGKIIFFTGLLDYLKTDAEIAAIIGHEVGHAAARLPAEAMFGIIRG
ncbi:metalloendopeptidase [Orobanche minor]